MILNLINKYWPIFIMVILFLFIIFISSSFWEGGIFINIMQGEKEIWVLDIESKYKFVSVFVALLLGISFLFTGLFNIYKYNLVFIEMEVLKRDKEKLSKKITKLDNNVTKIIDEKNDLIKNDIRNRGIIENLISSIEKLKPRENISNELSNLYSDNLYVSYKLEFIEGGIKNITDESIESQYHI